MASAEALAINDTRVLSGKTSAPEEIKAILKNL